MAVPTLPIAGQPGQSSPTSGINLPKSPVGGSQGPGATPMVSPGDGTGMKAHVEDGVRSLMKQLLVFLNKLEPGTPVYKTLARALNDLNATFGRTTDVSSAPKMPAPVGNSPPMGIGGRPPGLPMRGGGGTPGIGAAPGAGMNL